MDAGSPQLTGSPQRSSKPRSFGVRPIRFVKWVLPARRFLCLVEAQAACTQLLSSVESRTEPEAPGDMEDAQVLVESLQARWGGRPLRGSTWSASVNAAPFDSAACTPRRTQRAQGRGRAATRGGGAGRSAARLLRHRLRRPSRRGACPGRGPRRPLRARGRARVPARRARGRHVCRPERVLRGFP